MLLRVGNSSEDGAEGDQSGVRGKRLLVVKLIGSGRTSVQDADKECMGILKLRRRIDYIKHLEVRNKLRNHRKAKL